MIKKIRTVIDKMRKTKYYYVCADIVPDINTCQGEMDSVVVKAKTEEAAREIAIQKFMKSWEADREEVWVAGVSETTADEYYNQ